MNKNKLRKNKDLIKLSRGDEDLQEMNYEHAIIYDKRSCLKIYWSYLVEVQIILGTFCTENYLTLFVIKLSFFVFTFQISFFLNAFFYTDEYYQMHTIMMEFWIFFLVYQKQFILY